MSTSMVVLSSGASVRGLVPTSSSASHSSMPAMVALSVYDERRSAERVVDGTVAVEPSELKKSLSAMSASTSTIGPAYTPICLPLTAATCSAATEIGRAHG